MAFHSVNNSNCVTLLFRVSHFKVFGSLVVGLWSSVQLPAPALPASAQQQHAEVPPGSDCAWGSQTCCNYFLVLGLSDWGPHGCFHFVQTTTCKKRSGNRSGKKERTTNHQFRNRLKTVGKLDFFIEDSRKKQQKQVSL